MKSMYGEPLDSNGYAPSIVLNVCDITYDGCYVCGCGGDLARHEIFPGPYRQKSKEYGLWIPLCPDCHRMAHETKNDMDALKKRAQIAAMGKYGWSTKDFVREFGKNYLQTII